MTPFALLAIILCITHSHAATPSKPPLKKSAPQLIQRPVPKSECPKLGPRLMSACNTVDKSQRVAFAYELFTAISSDATCSDQEMELAMLYLCSHLCKSKKCNPKCLQLCFPFHKDPKAPKGLKACLEAQKGRAL